MNSVVNVVHASEKAATILYYVCKVLYTANAVQVCPFLMQEGALDPWAQFLKTVMELPVPPLAEAAAHEFDPREKSVHWKIKAIAAKLSYRFISSYGVLTLKEGNPD